MNNFKDVGAQIAFPQTNTPQNEKPIMVTYFDKGIRNTKPKFDAPIAKVLEKIKNGFFEDKINALRSQIKGTPQHTAFKDALPYFTPSGTFSSHKNENLTKHSGLICLDFDNICEIEKASILAQETPYTFASFISPSGNGLKILCKISPDKHEQSFYGLCGYYKRHLYLEPDYKVKAVFMACFVSSDAYLYHNPIATTWTI
jgi:hypothetical protein